MALSAQRNKTAKADALWIAHVAGFDGPNRLRTRTSVANLPIADDMPLATTRPNIFRLGSIEIRRQSSQVGLLILAGVAFQAISRPEDCRITLLASCRAASFNVN